MANRLVIGGNEPRREQGPGTFARVIFRKGGADTARAAIVDPTDLPPFLCPDGGSSRPLRITDGNLVPKFIEKAISAGKQAQRFEHMMVEGFRQSVERAKTGRRSDPGYHSE